MRQDYNLYDKANLKLNAIKLNLWEQIPVTNGVEESWFLES
jgi:hypothetical protein